MVQVSRSPSTQDTVEVELMPASLIHPQERTKEIQESISQVYGIQAKKAAGLNLSAADLQVLSSYPSLHDEIQDMMTNQIR